MSTQSAVAPHSQAGIQVQKQPPYHVILLDDDDHTYEYVIEMLQKLFGISKDEAFLRAREVDATGCVILDTTTRERAEFKRDQVHGYGKDWRVAECSGGMTAVIQPARD